VSVEMNGKSSLAGYVKAFERVRGRAPTEEEGKEALALADILEGSAMDPYLLHALVFKTELAETRLAVREATEAAKMLHDDEQNRIRAAIGLGRRQKVELGEQTLKRIEAVVARARVPAEEEAPPDWTRLSLVIARERWPQITKTVADLIALKWPVWLMTAALAAIVLAVVWVAASGAQRARDSADQAALATPAGAIAAQLAAANPSLVTQLRSCKRSFNEGRTVLSGCSLWAPTRLARGKPSWWTGTTAFLATLDPVPLFGAVLMALVLVALLCWVKRGPPIYRVRPRLFK
jgi:hypothetical protein